MDLEDWQLEQAFAQRYDISEDGLPEDLSIVHSDGIRSCVNYELRGQRFHLVDTKENPYAVL